MREVRQAAVRKEMPLPTGTYRVLYADPPWKYNDDPTSVRASLSETA
jgi:hypothetical protein